MPAAGLAKGSDNHAAQHERLLSEVELRSMALRHVVRRHTPRAGHHKDTETQGLHCLSACGVVAT